MDPQEKKLVRSLAGGDARARETAWRNFLTDYGDFIYRIAHRLAGPDEDDAGEVFLFVVEALSRTKETKTDSGFARFQAYQKALPDHPGSTFKSWLAQVCANLFVDWKRTRYGRRTVPKAVSEQGAAAEELYKLLYWQGQSRAAALHRMLADGWVQDENDFDRLEMRVECRLDAVNRWSIVTETGRRRSAVSLDTGGCDGDGLGSLTLPDTSFDPETDAEKAAAAGVVQRVYRILERLMATRSLPARRAIGLWSEGLLKAKEIAQLVNWENPKQVYSEVERLKGELLAVIRKEGIAWEDIEPSVTLLNGALEKWAHAPEND